MATTPEASSENTKIRRPDPYHGNRDQLEDWLMQVEVYFIFYSTPENKKTLFAASLLKGKALRWFKPSVRKHIDDNKDPDQMFSRFENFKEQIRRIFGPSNEESTAERAIQHLSQRTSAADYAARFQESSNQTEWDDAALMVMFCRGLKDNVKDELMRTGASIDSLDTLIEQAIEIDDKLYKRSMEKRYGGGYQGRAGSYSGYHHHQSRRPVNTSQYGDPMEIDATQRRNGKNPKGKQDRRKEKKCYTCGKPGHYARNCRSKNVVQQRQFNATLRTTEDEDDPKDSDDKKSTTSEPISEDDEGFCIINNPKQLEDVLTGRTSVKAAASTQEVNKAIEYYLQPCESPDEIDAKAEELLSEAECQTNTFETMMDRLQDMMNQHDATLDAYMERANREAQRKSQWPNDPADETTKPLNVRPNEEGQSSQSSKEPSRVSYEPYDRVPHVQLHWSGCYDDTCQIHQSSKANNNWFPKRPRLERQNATTGSGNGNILW